MSDPGNPLGNIQSILQQSQDKLNQVTPSSVGINCILWGSVSVVTIIAFNILRPRNKIVYEPKVKYHVGEKQRPPKISDGFFSWLSPLLHTKEPELMDKVGLDAVTFLRFLRMLRWLFLAIALLVSAMLLPVNVVYSEAHTPAAQRDALSILTIRDVRGNLLYTHVAATYLATFMVLGAVWYHWKQMARLRRDWFMSDEYQKSFYARTLMILDVPRKLQSDEGLVSLFQSLQMPYPTTSVHVGRRVGKLPELVDYHNDAVRQLERHLVKYLKGGKIGPKRPTVTKGGCLGLGGEKKDAIDLYTAKLKKTESAIEQWRNDIDLRQVEPYGFASLASVPFAHTVAFLLRGKHPRGTTVTLAPNPKDLIWSNLNSTAAERRSKQWMGFFWLSVVCFFNTLPLIIISALANLTSLAAIVQPINTFAANNSRFFSLVSSILPPIVASLFGYFLPIAMRRLSRYQGATTRTRLDRAVVARYFAFLIISQFFIFSLIGVGINSWGIISSAVGKHQSFAKVLQDLSTLPSQIHKTYIQQANYWLTFFPLRGFLVVFDLAQVLNLLATWVKTRLFGRTPRDIREWTKPPDFEYDIYYSNLLFMAAVGLVFAPLAPLVAVATAVVFWLSSLVYKYQLMFVFVTKIESGGRLWNVVINRLLVSTVFMQVLMTLTIGLREGFKTWTWTATLPPIILVPIFKYVCNNKFDKDFRYYIPSEAELRKSQVYSATADTQGQRLEKRFGHPALYADLFTPLVHARMVDLLPQVYQGKLGHGTATIDEYDGQKLEAQVLPGGIKIAGVEQRDLEYDPRIYGRDRGEADNFDARSSRHLLGDAASFAASKVSLAHSYMNPHGHHGAWDSTPEHEFVQHPIELTRLDTRGSDGAPLLRPRSYSSHLPSPGGPYLTPDHSNSQLGGAPYMVQEHASSRARLSPSPQPGQYMSSDRAYARSPLDPQHGQYNVAPDRTYARSPLDPQHGQYPPPDRTYARSPQQLPPRAVYNASPQQLPTQRPYNTSPPQPQDSYMPSQRAYTASPQPQEAYMAPESTYTASTTSLAHVAAATAYPPAPQYMPSHMQPGRSQTTEQYMPQQQYVGRRAQTIDGAYDPQEPASELGYARDQRPEYLARDSSSNDEHAAVQTPMLHRPYASESYGDAQARQPSQGQSQRGRGAR